MILVDTNILGRLCHENDPLRIVSLNALRVCRRQDQRLILVPQIIYEFYVTATRPAKLNGLEMGCDRSMRWANYFRHAFIVLDDPPQLLGHWLGLLNNFKTVGKRAHDARLVSAMQLHGISSILTYNVDDFIRYPITVLDPKILK